MNCGKARRSLLATNHRGDCIEVAENRNISTWINRQIASDRPETHILQTFLQFSSGNLAISAGIHLVEPVRGPRPAI